MNWEDLRNKKVVIDLAGESGTVTGEVINIGDELLVVKKTRGRNRTLLIPYRSIVLVAIVDNLE